MIGPQSSFNKRAVPDTYFQACKREIWELQRCNACHDGRREVSLEVPVEITKFFPTAVEMARKMDDPEGGAGHSALLCGAKCRMRRSRVE